MNKMRDEVKKGTSPAQLIAADVKQLGMGDLADGCNRPRHHPEKRRRVEGGNCMPSGAVLNFTAGSRLPLSQCKHARKQRVML